MVELETCQKFDLTRNDPLHNINILNNLPPASSLGAPSVPSGRLIGCSGGAEVRLPCRGEGASAGCELTADDQGQQGRKPSATGGYLLHLREVTNNSFPLPGLNIRGPVLTTYLKRKSIGLFSERLNWATNFQNPVIRERFPGLSINRGRGNYR